MLAQTFYITDPTYDVTGLYITDVTLYFAKTPGSTSNIGVTVTINEVENGVPTQNIIPFAKCRYTPDIIPADAFNGTYATAFTFGIPPFLKTQTQYAIVVAADGNHPDYELWTGQINADDKSAPSNATNKKITTNSSVGVLLTSSDGRSWTAYQDEDLKFTLRKAKFPYSNTGYSIFTNANTEYLVRDTINQRNPFLRGEKIYVSNGVTDSSNITLSPSSTTITLYPANSSYTSATNKLIYISAENYAQTDIRQIISVVNNPGANTQITINAAPTFTSSNASLGFLHSNGALYGAESYINGPRHLILYQSTANTTMNFRKLFVEKNTQPLLIGQLSGTAANLHGIAAVRYDEAVAQFAYSVPPKTSLSIFQKGFSASSNTMDANFLPLIFDKNQKFIDKLRIVRSRSDELYYSGGTKSLQIKVNFETSSENITPVLNNIKQSMLMIHNRISKANTTLITNETNPPGGSLPNKYISKSVELLQTAEDLIVYLTAYRPLNTEIYVFCKLLNSEDPDSFSNKYWTLMEEVTPKPYSSKADLTDMRELQFKIPSGNNSTTTTTGFTNSDNNNVVRYYTSTGDYFDGYNTFAIKIILTADQSFIVPRVADMRAIAVQV
jgi:hypothetical protein